MEDSKFGDFIFYGVLAYCTQATSSKQREIQTLVEMF